MNFIKKAWDSKFSFRVTFAIVSLLVIIVAFQAFLAIFRERTIMLNQVNREKTIIAGMIRSSSSSGEVLQTPALKREIVKEAVISEDIYFCRIVRLSGEIYITNIEEERGLYIQNQALLNLEAPLIIKQVYENEIINVVVTPPSYRGYIIMLGYSLKSIDNAILQMIVSNLSLSIFFIICAAVISIVVTNKMVLPILDLTRGASIIGGGNLDFRIQVKSGGEIGMLSNSFNKMTEELKKTTVSKDYMNRILNNMAEAVIIFNKKLKVTLVNVTACELLEYKATELTGMSLNTIFSSSASCSSGLTINNFLEKERLKNIETCFRTQGGREVPVLISISVMKHNTSEIQNIICVARDISEQKKAQAQLNQIHNKLLETAHQAGMAEIASGILHNIGNIATSINVSIEKLSEVIGKSKITNVVAASGMLKAHEADYLKYLEEDEKGKHLPAYFAGIGERLQSEYTTIAKEIGNLSEKITLVKNVIDTQQEYAYSNLFYEDLYLVNIIEDALKIENNTLYKNGVEVVKEFPHPESIVIHAQKSKLIDIFINLFRNACDALKNTPGQRLLKIKIHSSEHRIEIEVADNGTGIEKENLKKIFNFGFTTRPEGFGFGLHSCAIFMNDMKGEIKVASDGPGCGAVFTLIFNKEGSPL